MSPSIYIYHIVPPPQLVEAQEQLGQLLFQVEPSDQERQMSLSPTSGCLYFVDSGKIWANAGGPIPESAMHAETLARSFMESSNKRISGSALRSLGVTAIFPTDAKLTVVQPVFAREGNTPDHWLCSFVGYQRTGLLDSAPPAAVAQQTVAPVLGAQVDIRIGADLEVVSLWSNWRPIRAMELVEALSAPAGGESQLVYQGGGHDEPQEILSPYYIVPGSDNDTAQVSPASRYSLLVQISREDNEESTSLSAGVTGNTGPLSYSWGAWRLDTNSAGLFESLGSSASIQLPAGAYNVVLDVEDQVTRVFARLQCMSIAGPPRHRRKGNFMGNSIDAKPFVLPSGWTFQADLRDDAGLVLNRVRHADNSFATDMRIVKVYVFPGDPDKFGIFQTRSYVLGRNECPSLAKRMTFEEPSNVSLIRR